MPFDKMTPRQPSLKSKRMPWGQAAWEPPPAANKHCRAEGASRILRRKVNAGSTVEPEDGSAAAEAATSNAASPETTRKPCSAASRGLLRTAVTLIGKMPQLPLQRAVC